MYHQKHYAQIIVRFPLILTDNNAFLFFIVHEEKSFLIVHNLIILQKMASQPQCLSLNYAHSAVIVTLRHKLYDHSYVTKLYDHSYVTKHHVRVRNIYRCR